MRARLENELDCLASYYQGGASNLSSGSRVSSKKAFSDYKDCGQKLAEAAVEAAKNFTDLEVGKIQVLSADLETESKRGTQILYAIAFGDFACVFAPFELSVLRTYESQHPSQLQI